MCKAEKPTDTAEANLDGQSEFAILARKLETATSNSNLQSKFASSNDQFKFAILKGLLKRPQNNFNWQLKFPIQWEIYICNPDRPTEKNWNIISIVILDLKFQ